MEVLEVTPRFTQEGPAGAQSWKEQREQEREPGTAAALTQKRLGLSCIPLPLPFPAQIPSGCTLG